jgi:hypothetical protein
MFTDTMRRYALPYVQLGNYFFFIITYNINNEYNPKLLKVILI